MPAVFLAAVTVGDPDPAEIEATLARLRAGTVEERIEAARWLGLRGVAEAEDDLRAIYRDARDPRLVAVIRQMLELLQSPGLVRWVEPVDVLDALDADDPEDRVEALRHVVYHGLAEGLPRVLQLLRDPDEHQRVMALWALGAIDPSREQGPVVLPLLEDPAGSVRTQALLYFRGHVGPDLVPPVVDRLADPSEDVRGLAAKMLEQGGNGAAAAAEVFQRLNAVDDPPALVAWMDALAGWRPADHVPSPPERRTLRGLLSHPEGEVVVAAAALLASSGDRGAVRLLRVALAHDDAGLRLRAVRALAGAGVAVDVPTVAGLLDDADTAVRHSAFDLVPALDPSEARTMLRSAIAGAAEPASSLGQDDVLLGRVIQALAEVGEVEDVRSILELGERSGSEFVRISALIGLGPLERRVGSRESLRWVRRLLQDPGADRSVISAAMFPLRDLGDPSFLPLLSGRLRTVEGDPSLAGELAETISMLLGRRLHGPTFLAEPRP